MFKKITFSILLLILIASLGLAAWVVSMIYVFGDKVSLDYQTLPPITVDNIEQWENGRDELIRQFEENIYGNIPRVMVDWQIEKRVIDENAYKNTAIILEWIMTDPTGQIEIPLVIAEPKNTDSNRVLVATSFCANHNAFPEHTDMITKSDGYPPFCDDPGNLEPIMKFVFGDMLATYPVKQLIDQGITIVSFYPGDVAADNSVLFRKDLGILSTVEGREISGTVAAWAWAFREIAREYREQSRKAEISVYAYGHSRNGKASLLSAAVYPEINGAISHQSGTGGASLSRSDYGESVDAVTSDYGFWLGPGYKKFANNETALPIDQHQLIGLAAPKSLLLTGARLDEWSDPKGAFAAMRYANPVYQLYGVGTSAEKLTDFYPAESLSFFMRPAFHGVRTSDWNAFIEFLNNH